MNNYCITFDIDWAPDFAIEKAANILIENNIKCTWFITHSSPYIEKLFQHKDIFEFGIHPNFFTGSTHGKTVKEVLQHICSIVPGSKVVRTHALYQSSRLLSTMIEDFGIELDCSLLLYLTPGIIPHRIYFKHDSKGILRIPFFWEDDIDMYNPKKISNINSSIYHQYGIKIFNFHPIFTFLNSETMDIYNNLKLKKTIHLYKEEELTPNINKNSFNGTYVFFNDLVKYIIENKTPTFTLTELKNQYYKIKDFELS